MDRLKNRALLALGAIICSLAITACSSDADLDRTDEWRDNLKSVNMMVSHHNIVGYQIPDIGIKVSIRNKNGEDMLHWDRGGNMADSDWYFETDGKQYHKGDIMPVGGNTEPVSVIGWMAYNCACIFPTQIDWTMLKESPAHYSYYFVWPSRGIRTKLDVYAELNKDFESQREAALQRLSEQDPDGCEEVELFKIGFWADGKKIENRGGDSGLYVVTID